MTSNIALGLLIATYLGITLFTAATARTHGRAGAAIVSLHLPR